MQICNRHNFRARNSPIFFSLAPIYYTLVFKDRKGLQPQGNSKAEKEIKSKL